MAEKPSHERNANTEDSVKVQNLSGKTTLERFMELSRRLVNVSNSEIKPILKERTALKKEQNVK